MSSRQPQKGGDGVAKQDSSKVARVFKTVGIWLLLALAAAAIAAVVQLVPLCLRAGVNGCGKAIREGFPGAGDPVTWARSLLNLVILVASLAVAVRIMYPPKDLEESDVAAASGNLTRRATGPNGL
jgi:uncharacterized membrane protein